MDSGAYRYIVPYWRRLTLVLAISVASTALSLYLPSLTRPLVDVALLGRDGGALTNFVVMFIAQNRANQFGPVGPQWLFWVYALHTIGELMLSPVGLSLVSRVAPHRIAGLLMGVWFIANGIANYFAGALEGLLAGSGIPPYQFLLASSIGMGVLLLILTPVLNRMLQARDKVEAPDAPLQPALA